MDYPEGAQIHGFVVEERADLPEIEGTAYVMRHVASKARLLYLANDDDNKAFSIAFKTPPANSTGVFHILEHSVLCGSEKFPVKEPFVNLIKTSMQTFLNAMTFPDKTVYPVASTNETDLMNLMDVYLDAVLNPAIYQKEQIFLQEGWHLENEDGQLAYNGVVYNEMKGALSDPGSVLQNALSAQLFPDTAYRFDSGGEPEEIPSLTYQEFLSTHARHYRLDNSYLTLYGNLDLDRFLAFLDQRYLGPCATLRTDAGSPNVIDLQAPVTSFDRTVRMATAPENAEMMFGYVVGTVQDRTRLIAADILLDAVSGSNEAPLKRMLLDQDLGAEVLTYLDDSVLQPYAILTVKGLHEGAAARVKPAIEDAVRQILEDGIDGDLIEAALSHAEFIMRERNFGMSDGVAFAISALTGWLHDDSLSYAYLRYEDVFAYLRTQLDTGYFEQLLKELFLENPHAAAVELIPVGPEDAPASAAADRLAALQEQLSEDDLAKIDRDVALLRQAQEQPDSPEDLAKLPRLGVADIGPAPTQYPTEVLEDGPVRTLRHHIPAHGIAYAYHYYGLECVDFEDLPYVTVLAMVLGKLDTANRSAADLDTLAQSKLGNLSFFAEAHEHQSGRDNIRPVLAVSCSALESKADSLAQLPLEVLHATLFQNTDKIGGILGQKKVAIEHALMNNGHSIAASRVNSYHLPIGVLRQQLGGIEFYLFLRDLVQNYEDRAEALCAKLADLAQRIFRPANCLISFTGTDDALRAYNESLEQALAAFAGETASLEPAPAVLQIPKPQARNEAFVVPSDVVFASVGYDRRLIDDAQPYGGAWLIASRMLSLDYLWNEVRVKGGAYGTGFTAARLGNTRFYSYRDPHLDETIARFEEAGAWLAQADPSDDELEGDVVSTVSGMDSPTKPRDLARRQLGWHFSGLDPADLLVTRQEVIDSSLDEVRAVADTITACTKDRPRCVVGNTGVIAASKLDWNVVELL